MIPAPTGGGPTGRPINPEPLSTFPPSLLQVPSLQEATPSKSNTTLLCRQRSPVTCEWSRICSCKRSSRYNWTSGNSWSRARRRPTDGQTAGARRRGARPRVRSSGGWRRLRGAGAGSWRGTWRSCSGRSEGLPLSAFFVFDVCLLSIF